MAIEFTPELAAKVAQAVLFGAWRGQIEAGHLTDSGLAHVRMRLYHDAEFPATDPDVGLMRMFVDEAIAKRREVGLDAMPGRELPNTVAEAEELGDWRPEALAC